MSLLLSAKTPLEKGSPGPALSLRDAKSGGQNVNLTSASRWRRGAARALSQALFVPIALMTAGAMLASEAQAELKVYHNDQLLAKGDQTPSRLEGTDFGSMLYTVSPVEHSFRVVNSGSSTVYFGDALSSSSIFMVTGVAPSLAPGAHDDFTVAFAPSQQGFVKSAIALTGASRDDILYNFAVQGTGVAPTPPPPPPPNEHPEPEELPPSLPNFNPADIAVEFASVEIYSGDTSPTATKGTDFGSADINTGAVIRTFRLINRGGFPLPVNLAHSSNPEFVVEGMPEVGVPGDSYLDFQITFLPQYTGARTATISILNGDPDEGEFTFRVSGVGVAYSNNKQEIYGANVETHRNSTVSIPLYYDVNNGDNTLNGIGFSIHFDSSALSFAGFEGMDSFGAELFNFSDVAMADTANLDNDLATDVYVQVQYANLVQGAEWPGVSLPLMLGKVVFQTTAGIAPGGSSTVRFSPISTAGAYGFASTPFTVSIANVTSDLDGNGQVSGLSDGLLYFRHLFRMPDFSKGAIGAGASRNATEIRNYIDANKLPYLDFDGNGEIAALSDGLLFFRHLFRVPDFAQGALGAGSTRTPTQIASYIDSLKPGVAQPMAMSAEVRPMAYRASAFVATQAASARQIVSPSQPTIQANAGDELAVSWSYSVSDGAAGLNGLLLRVHFDSSLLQFQQAEWINDTGADVVYSEPVQEPDTDDLDGDPVTDAFLLVGWASFNLSWPGVESLEDLMTLRFKAVAGGDTALHITAAETTPGYVLDAPRIEVAISGVAPSPSPVFPSVLQAFGKEADSSGYVYAGEQMGYVYVGAHPYVWHDGLGWFTVGHGDASRGLWIWDYELGWMWMQVDMYPFTYSAAHGSWLYNLPGAPTEHGMRWFFDFAGNGWFSSR